MNISFKLSSKPQCYKMACARNLRKSMFTKLDLLRILSRHHCIILHDKPASFSEIRKNTMANTEEAMDTNLLELDPADEEACKDSVGGGRRTSLRTW